MGLDAAEEDHGHDGEDGDDDADADKDGGRPERRRQDAGKVVQAADALHRRRLVITPSPI